MSTAQFKWAQRPDAIFVSVDVVDAKDVKVDFTAKEVAFTATVNGAAVEGKLALEGEIVPEKSSWVNTEREVQIKLAKKEDDAEYWDKLVQKKMNNLKVDWAKWKDEDELDGGDADMGDFGMGGMPGMGGMGGMPGMGGMGGMPGMGGAGGMDMEALMAQMGGMGGAGGMPGGMPPGMEMPDSDDEEPKDAPNAE